MTWDLATVQFASDMTACVLGMIFNSLLIVAIFKETDQNLRSYSYLLLASASFDLFFSIVEFCTLHQLLSVSGVLVIMSHGFVERFLFPYVGPLLMIPHVFAANHGLLILVSQHHYRYRIVSGGDASVGVLIRDLSVTCGLGWLMAIMAWWGTVVSGRRGREYYLDAVNSQTFYKRAEEFYLYVSDQQDWITTAYFKSSFWFTYICFGVSIFYALKSYLHVRSNGAMGNSRTERLQSQFTKSLIVQTLNTCIFALIPLSFSSIPMQFSNDSQLHGFITMILISWLSTANAICTLSIVRSYRIYFFKLIGLERFVHASVTVEVTGTSNHTADTRTH
ncbi:hypothetical protein M3Y94_00101000 [Aphelenchoides besseyi]|nr:hypothetical protein M3Y94_00101000 [Aphelenchoides besseyi]KAI6237592.1 hypothetical protein M3Y95_00281600 [Aphelenchoides besseyi]